MRVSASFAVRSAAAVVLSVLPVATGCVDKENCNQAITTTRDALSKNQPDLARQWRDRAWKVCNDPTQTEPLDKEIVAKEAEIAKTATDQQQAVAQAAGAAAQARMNTATNVWKGFDKLDPKDQTVEQLGAYRAKAAQMSQGLPPEYAAQVDAYNAREFAKRQTAVQAAAKK
jgi:hypothetical protein